MTEAKKRKLNVNFFLRGESGQPLYIYQICRWTTWDRKKKKLVVSTGHAVARDTQFQTDLPRKHKDFQRVKAHLKGAATINSDLDDRVATAVKRFDQFQDQHPGELPTTKQLKQLLFPSPEMETTISSMDPIPYFRKMAQQKSHPSTRIQYHQTVKILQKWVRGSLEWGDIDRAFIMDFHTHLTRKTYTFKNGDTKERRHFTRNNIGKHMGRIKALMNQALVDEIPGAKFHNSWVKVQRESPKAVFLNEDELDQMFHMKFKKGEARLANARDLFIIGTWTGLRFSDYSRVTEDNIQDGFINMGQQKKGGQEVWVPIHPQVQAIIDKGIPSPISNQKMNDYLKQIAERIPSLHETITVKRFEGSSEKQKERTFPRWQLVSTHSARRSFASNLYLRGYPSSEIMLMTGHSTVASFLSYIQIDQKQRNDLNKERFQQMFGTAK